MDRIVELKISGPETNIVWTVNSFDCCIFLYWADYFILKFLTHTYKRRYEIFPWKMLGSTTTVIEQAVHIPVSLLCLGNRGTPGGECCDCPGWQSPRGYYTFVWVSLLDSQKYDYFHIHMDFVILYG